MTAAAVETSGDDAAPRCGAKLRSGGRCPLPPAAGKRRCFQHSGARGSGAAKGNRNNGFYTPAAMAERKRINGFISECLRTLREIDGR